MTQLNSIIKNELESIHADVLSFILEAQDDHDPSLYSGLNGMLLFLAESNQILQDPLTKEIIQSTIQKLIRSTDTNPSFYVGKYGITLLLIRLYEIEKNEDYLDCAMNFALSNINSIKVETLPCEILNGSSGILLGTTLLLGYKGSPDLEEFALSILDTLIEFTRLHSTGIYWDRSNRVIRSLAGLSHGVGGIAHSVQELAKLSKHQDLLYIPRLAFAFEDNCLNRKKNNWLDLRKTAYDSVTEKKFQIELENRNISFFNQADEMLAWCHGAPGSNLIRTRYLQLSHDFTSRSILHKSEVNIGKALEKGYFDGSHSLCHGLSGTGMFYHEKWRLTANEKYFDSSRYCIEKLLMLKKQHGGYTLNHMTLGNESCELMVGKAGIGYLYTHHLLKCTNYSSAFLPTVNETGTHTLKTLHRGISKFSKNYVQKRIIENNLEVKLSSTSTPKLIDSKYIESINTAIKNAISNCNDALQKEILLLGFKRIQFDWKSPSYAYLYYDSLKNQSLIQNITDNARFTTPLAISKHIKFYKIPRALKINNSQKIDYLVWKQNSWRVVELALTKELVNIAMIFKIPRTVSEAFDIFLSTFNFNGEINLLQFYEEIITGLIQMEIITVIREENPKSIST